MPRIVVPVDETELSENALPWAAELARALNYGIHLVAVYDYDAASWKRAGIEVEASGPAGVAESLQAYLQSMSVRPVLAGIPVSTEVRLGDAAEQIGDTAMEGDTAYVVIASQGEGGLKRFARGSVADSLARHLAIPILVVRPGLDSARIARVLVTLDGSETSERALGPARQVAAAAGAELHLLRVVNPVTETAWTGIGPAPDLAEITRQLTDAALVYLQARADEGDKFDVQFGRPLDVILAYARDNGCDIIAMGTHGRGGIVRLALGSTADAVMRSSDRPVLMVPDREP